MWYKVNKRYVGTQKVRPWDITETYTVPQATSTGSWVSNFLSIYKSWYKVTKVVIEATGASNSTSNYWNINCWIRLGNSWNTYRFARWVWANNYSKIEYSDGSFHDIRTNLWWSQTWTNTIKLTIWEDSWSLTINWTTTNRTTTSTEKTIIQWMFNSSTINANIIANRWYIWPATYTVTYKPN